MAAFVYPDNGKAYVHMGHGSRCVMAVLLIFVSTYQDYYHGLDIGHNTGMKGQFRISQGATRISPLCHKNFTLALSLADGSHCFTRSIKSGKQLRPGLELCIFILLMQTGDINPNPGPVKDPCGECGKRVRLGQGGVCCGHCDVWYHKKCLDMSTAIYDTLHTSHVVWICCKCGIPNFNSSYFHSYELQTENSFRPLEDDHMSTHSPDSTVSPNATSTPTAEGKKKQKKKPKKINWRTMVVNCRSIKNKVPEFHAAVEYLAPDVIMGTESWLDPSINNAEVFPPGFIVFRKDRKREETGGGEFLAIKDSYIATECKNWMQTVKSFGQQSKLQDQVTFTWVVTTGHQIVTQLQ